MTSRIYDDIKTPFMKKTSIQNISPSREYYLQEILELRLIPGVDGYTGLYNLVTDKVLVEKVSTDKAGKPRLTKDGQVRITRAWKRDLASRTTNRSMKAEHDGNPWRTIKGKIKVRGAEIIEFLRKNDLWEV